MNSKSLMLFYRNHQTKIKFLFVGGWNTIFGFVAFVVLYKLFAKVFNIDYFAYTTAQVVGTILSIINAYIFHKYITFNSRTKGKAMLHEFLRFNSTYLVLFFFGLASMPLLVEVLKIRPIPASIILNIVTIATSYFGHSRFSFKKTNS